MRAHPKPNRTGLISPLLLVPTGATECQQADAESSDTSCVRCLLSWCMARNEQLNAPAKPARGSSASPGSALTQPQVFHPGKSQAVIPSLPAQPKLSPRSHYRAKNTVPSQSTAECPRDPANIMMLWLFVKTLGAAGRKSGKIQLTPGERLAQQKALCHGDAILAQN